jgi:hypothetical protein
MIPNAPADFTTTGVDRVNQLLAAAGIRWRK